MSGIEKPFTSAFSSFRLLVIFVLVWISIELWNNVYNNFVYGTLGLNKHSTKDSFYVALAWTSVIMLFLVGSDEFKDFSDSVAGGTPIRQIKRAGKVE